MRVPILCVAAVVMAPSDATVRAQLAEPSIEARIDTIVARQMRAKRIPGLSLGVVRDGRLIHAKGYGEANIEWKAPATPETVYLLASVTKQFTATAVMMLVSDGRVGLDDPIAKYVATDQRRGMESPCAICSRTPPDSRTGSRTPPPTACSDPISRLRNDRHDNRCCRPIHLGSKRLGPLAPVGLPPATMA